MIILKVIYHLNAICIGIFYKIIYGGRYVVGKNVTYRAGFKVAIEGKNSCVEIGKNCFFNNYCSINCMNHISIGDGTIMGEGVKIYDHNHRFANPNVRLKEQGFTIGETIIGKNCWIASNAVILKGANIGDHCVIGAGCIVDYRVPSNSVVKMSKNEQIEPIKGK